MSHDVTITEAIERLREQLEEAQRKSSGHEIQFVAKAVEVELTIAFKTSIEGGAGAKAWFLDISGKGQRDDESSHRIKLVLEPRDKSNEPTRVGDRGRD